jgi:hypothetical protein
MKIKQWIALTIALIGLCILSQTARAQDEPIYQRTPDIGQVAERFQRPSTITITGADIGTLSGKLQNFRQNLSPGEQAVMDQMLRRAAAAPANDPEGTDVKGAPVLCRNAAQFPAAVSLTLRRSMLFARRQASELLTSGRSKMTRARLNSTG